MMLTAPKKHSTSKGRAKVVGEFKVTDRAITVPEFIQAKDALMNLSRLPETELKKKGLDDDSIAKLPRLIYYSLLEIGISSDCIAREGREVTYADDARLDNIAHTISDLSKALEAAQESVADLLGVHPDSLLSSRTFLAQEIGKIFSRNLQR